MKKLLWIVVVLMVSCQDKSNDVEKMEETVLNLHLRETSDDMFMEGIENKIYNAFVESYRADSPVGLASLLDEMSLSDVDAEPQELMYWKSYLKFYAAIYYLEKGNRKLSEKEVEQGIDWMEEIPNKSSEDYALLAMLQSFSLQFKGMKAMFLAPKVKKNAENALALDPENVRAYYVLGGNDFYTPEKYGGGKVAEKYLLKAIELPENHEGLVGGPTWGKEESYELLVRLYQRNGDVINAQKFKEEGLALYPQSYLINRINVEKE